MWHENLLRIIKEKNLSPKQIADAGNISEKTVTRVIKHPDNSCYLVTLDRIAKGVGCTLEDIVLDTKAVAGNENLATLQENVAVVAAERDAVIAERDLLIAENTTLKEKVTVQEKEIDLLKLKLLYTEELLATHKFYNKSHQN